MNKRQLTSHSSVGKHPDRLSHPALSAGRIGHAEEPSEHTAGGFSRILRRLLLTGAVTALAGAVFVTALSMVAWNSADPTALMRYLSPVALGLTSLVSGITAGKCCSDRPVAGGLVSGCLFAGRLCLIGLLGGDMQGLPIPLVWLIRLSTIPVQVMGGIIARPKQRSAAHTTGKHSTHRY